MATASQSFYWSDVRWLLVTFGQTRLAMAVARDLLTAAAMTAMFATRETGSVWTGVTMALLGVATLLRQREHQDNRNLPPLAVIFASLALSVPLSRYYGGYWVSTAMISMSVAPLGLLVLIRPDVRRVIYYMVPVSYVHAAVIGWQFINGVVRAEGITYSPNPAGGFLVLIATFLIANRRPWLAMPLALAVLPTQSRLALGVLVVVLGFSVLRGRVSWRWLLVTLIAVVAMMSAGHKFRALEIAHDIPFRLTIERSVSLWPTGFIGFGDGPPHDVPMRLAIELGIPAAIAWAWLSMKGIARRHQQFRPLMMVIVLLATLDYYVWVGPMAGFWWLLVTTQSAQRPEEVRTK